MGNHHGTSSRKQTDETNFVLISNKAAEECLRFDTSQSYAVAYGTNYQTNPRFKKRQLSQRTVQDSSRILSSLETRVVPREHSSFFEAKQAPQSCTFEGIRQSLKAEAEKVRVDGIFFFHASSDGVKTGQFGLAPVDFDYSEKTLSVLRQWLPERDYRRGPTWN